MEIPTVIPTCYYFEKARRLYFYCFDTIEGNNSDRVGALACSGVCSPLLRCTFCGKQNCDVLSLFYRGFVLGELVATRSFIPFSQLIVFSFARSSHALFLNWKHYNFRDFVALRVVYLHNLSYVVSINFFEQRNGLYRVSSKLFKGEYYLYL